MISLLCLVFANLLTTSNAINLVKRDMPSIIEMPIQRKPFFDPQQPDTNAASRDRLRKRVTKTVQETLANEETLYFANVTLGTPPQALRLHVDTGSSDLWTNSASSSLCQQNVALCTLSGTYNANASSTYKYVNSVFNISYVDRSGATGDYGTDNLVIGGDTLDALQFGIGYRSTSEEGILGVGYPVNEVQVNHARLQPYANVPAFMQQSGLINSMAFSLWLNDLNANTGSILFGGVDTDKYHGSLHTLPIIPEYGVYAEFLIGMTGIGINGTAGSVASNQTIAVLLDSGSSLTYLPNNIAQSILTQFGAQYSASKGAAIVDCSLGQQTGSVDFTFSTPTISVPLNELVLLGGYTNGKPYCIFGIAPAEGSSPVLGDTFLRSAYVVYDLSNNEISIAATNYNSTSNNVMEIARSSNGVPDATRVVNAITSVAAVQTGGAVLGGGNFSVTLSGVAVPMITPGPARAYGAGALAVAGLGAMLAL